MGQAVLVDDHPQWSGAAAAEERQGRMGSGPSAVARRAQPGGSGAGSARRVDGNGSRGTRSESNGDNPPLGEAMVVDDRPQWSAAAAAEEWPSPGTAAPAQPGE